MIYECWETWDRTDIHFGPPPARRVEAVDGDRMFARYSVRADSWEEAMQAHHEIQGWEPYR